MTDIKLGVDTLKKILERLPQNYSVSIQIDNTIFPAHSFEVDDEYGEIILRWFDLDYAEHEKHRYNVRDLMEENEKLKKELKELQE